MRVLVTGANGFLGGHLLRGLSAQGMEVVGLLRRGAERSNLPEEVTIREGNFTRPEEAAELMRAVRPDAVVHCAAVVSNGTPDLELSWAVNVQGTRCLMEAAKRQRVLRWVQISSMSAHPANRSVYGATKLAQEEVVRRSAIPFTILRPSLIYGPAQRGIFYRMARLVDRLPIVPLIGGGRDPVRPVHGDDVAAAVGACLERDWSIGRTYDLGGPEEWTLRDLVRAMRRLRAKPMRWFPLPLPICRIGAAMGESFLAEPPLTTDNIEGLSRARCLDPIPAKEELGFSPRSFEDGFREALDGGLLS